ncbi:hypothetical protein QP027_00920 [Corynebacterium breve]|uniref:DUF1643 domain-containing protein n=1 Tax=Corynebacterium breve TaxID=3049799 RepID=A0ABY8VEQ9_9CORY|nr:hypothetical protein [Corynebacterium breve]WIM67993.1 hypothetical protein QP027_00920 [Corynebacterium breve]
MQEPRMVRVPRTCGRFATGHDVYFKRAEHALRSDAWLPVTDMCVVGQFAEFTANDKKVVGWNHDHIELRRLIDEASRDPLITIGWLATSQLLRFDRGENRTYMVGLTRRYDRLGCYKSPGDWKGARLRRDPVGDVADLIKQLSQISRELGQ